MQAGANTTTTACVENGVTDPYVNVVRHVHLQVQKLMYKSDYDVHNAVFVDHLNTSGSGSSYTNWYNSKTGNSGIIHVTKSHMVGPFKCKDYDATIDITSSCLIDWYWWCKQRSSIWYCLSITRWKVERPNNE